MALLVIDYRRDLKKEGSLVYKVTYYFVYAFLSLFILSVFSPISFSK